MPAAFSMNAPAAARRCGRKRGIAACSAPTARCPVHRSKPSFRIEFAPLPAVPDSHRDIWYLPFVSGITSARDCIVISGLPTPPTSDWIALLSFKSSMSAHTTVQHLRGDLGLCTAHQDCSGSSRSPGDPDQAIFQELPMTACTTAQRLHSVPASGTEQQDCLANLRHWDDRDLAFSQELPLTACAAVRRPYSDLGFDTEQQDCLVNSQHRDDRDQALFPGSPMTSYAGVQNPHSNSGLGITRRDYSGLS